MRLQNWEESDNEYFDIFDDDKGLDTDQVIWDNIAAIKYQNFRDFL